VAVKAVPPRKAANRARPCPLALLKATPRPGRNTVNAVVTAAATEAVGVIAGPGGTVVVTVAPATKRAEQIHKADQQWSAFLFGGTGRGRQTAAQL